MLLGRAKSCRWQVFVRRRPPKQGELRTDVSKATMWGETGRRKDLIGLVQSCCLCALNRGLQNLDSFFEKGFNFVSAKLLFEWADSRFAKPRNFPVRETDWYFLRRAKSTAKTRRGLRPSGLPGTIQSSAEEDFSKVFRRHEPKPFFRTKRRRKGFESVRRSGVTA